MVRTRPHKFWRLLPKPIYSRFVQRHRKRLEAWVLAEFPDSEVAFTVAQQRVTIPTPAWYARYWYGKHCANGLPHEMAVSAHLVGCLSSARHFVDVGSHVGYFALLAASVIGAEKVFAFEMDPFHSHVLEQVVKAKSGRGPAVNVVKAAVSDRDGELNVTLDPGLGCPGKSMRGDRWCKNTVRVPTLRLDAYFSRIDIVPDVFKIDVEGAELMALKGMGNLLDPKIATVYVELHPNKLPGFGATIDDVLQYVTSRGYDPHVIRGHRSHAEAASLRRVTRAGEIEENSMVLLPGPRQFE